MSIVLSKKQMTEEDIKLNYITPAILKGWKGHITMETRITDGRINIRGNIVVRSKPKFVDYLLYLNDGKPIAVVEAKDNNHSVSHGLQQAMTYAQMMDLPFAYSSNGDAFYEHDFLTGQEQQIELEKFPTQDELIARYYAELNGGNGISVVEKKIVSQPYYSSQSTYPPRYYQRNAVNRTVEAIARGQQRLLLVMATGTGKTYTAFQIVYRLLRSDLKKRILYLADRNILVDQSIAQDFAPLEKTIYKVNFSDKECLREIASHEVKTKPMELKHFEDCITWWNNREIIPDGEYFKAQKFTADYLLNEQGCNIDLCGYPHEEEEVLDPLDTIREYQERRTTLNAEIDKVLAELEALLPGGVTE